MAFDDEQREAAAASGEREVPETIERLKALRCLAAVAEYGSTTRAAEVVHLSQPAVTRSILELERYFGQPLFERGGRGMAPTPLGTQLAARAERLQQLLALGSLEAQQLSTPPPRRATSPDRFAAAVTPASLKALLAVASRLTESAAAQALGVTQPAVHRSLRALEDACGAGLYIKSMRGTRLTDSGEALLRRVKLSVAELRAMEADLAVWGGQLRGRVVVGALPLSAHLVLSPAVAQARLCHPKIQITVVDGTYESLTHQLRSADVDIVIGALRVVPPAELTQELLFEDKLSVVARPGHPCLAHARSTLRQLLQWPWVVPLPNTPARAALDAAFAAAGLSSPPDDLQATSAQFTRSIVAHTDHLALASSAQAREDERAGVLRIVPVELVGTTRGIGIVIRSGGEPSPDLQALVDALREQAAQLRA